MQIDRDDFISASLALILNAVGKSKTDVDDTFDFIKKYINIYDEDELNLMHNLIKNTPKGYGSQECEFIWKRLMNTISKVRLSLLKKNVSNMVETIEENINKIDCEQK